jgi:hypothetical protein
MSSGIILRSEKSIPGVAYSHYCITTTDIVNLYLKLNLDSVDYPSRKIVPAVPLAFAKFSSISTIKDLSYSFVRILGQAFGKYTEERIQATLFVYPSGSAFNIYAESLFTSFTHTIVIIIADQATVTLYGYEGQEIAYSIDEQFILHLTNWATYTTVVSLQSENTESRPSIVITFKVPVI